MSENNAYVYGHYKATTGEPFYIGKGTGKRAWSKNGRNEYWNRVVNKHGYIVKILHENLSEEEAFNKEKELIKEIGLHKLVNIQEGGQGLTSISAQKLVNTSEWKVKHRSAMDSHEHREKMKKINTSRWQTQEFRKKQKDGIERLKQENSEFYINNARNLWKNAESREKMLISLKKVAEDKAKNPQFVSKMTEINQQKAQDPEWCNKIAEKNKNQAKDPDWREKHLNGHKHRRKSVTLISPIGEIVHVNGIKEFANLHGLSDGALSNVIHKKRKHHKGWKLYQPEEEHKISELT